MRDESGFTLIEMMIVLLIISVLMLIALPSMTKNNTIVKSLGCEATIDLVQGQVGAYEVEKNELPTIERLYEGKYIDTKECPDKTPLLIDSEGKVYVNKEDEPS
ncbi:competence type IV pilus major pilin ComGC [Fictibacillus phosphorivorans]|uniref:competence type IV pilus major pilin ComGC n=1 Tax=Fictibacillus phosphorivorans TaxID=1221500 RepID=UPI00203DDB37|nr:competence type IV pilus major pilin ComGC [Fictibacillus phosphorivorans]MCM3716793.1 prepilin-type N-terminal cleavage/methylation domain-containing protein [Fictibacillus phosphorivorans]MCM3774658.1 prepilin-type N-terminal cleavage/methylation domain-containing protein [Fictibacillus phosphorivorans]